MGRNNSGTKGQDNTDPSRSSQNRTHGRLGENDYHFAEHLIPRQHGVCKTSRGPSPATEELMSHSSCVLSTTELCFSYGGRNTVDRVNLQLQAGTLTALVGPNGAGKSTL